MRITVNIDDESLRLVKKYMKAEALNEPLPTRRVIGLLVFDPGRVPSRVTTKKVRSLL